MSAVVGEGWADKTVLLLGLLLGLIAVTTPLTYATLDLPLAAALQVTSHSPSTPDLFNS